MAQIGWIKIHRQITESFIYPNLRKFTEYEAWLHLLLNATFSDSRILDGSRVIEVKRGDILTSELRLSLEWRWGRDKVRGFLELLQKEKMIVKKSTTKFTIITICNYATYQDLATTEPTTKPQQKNNKATTKQQQNDTLEEGKEGKERKEGKEGKTKEIFNAPEKTDVFNLMFEKLPQEEAKKQSELFYNYYESNGWRVGKNKMKNWKAAATGWVSRIDNFKKQNNERLGTSAARIEAARNF